MSDLQTNANPNGQGNPASTPRKKQRVAVTKVDGSNIHIQFQPHVGGGEVHIDTGKIPGADKLSGPALHIFNHGVASLIQGSYTNSETDYHKTAKAMADRLLAGTWSPGRTRSSDPKEPDELLVALSEHLKIPVEDVEKNFLPAYARKHNLHAKDGGPGLAQARRMLRENRDVAPIIARIVAERAKRAAAQASKGPKEDLASML